MQVLVKEFGELTTTELYEILKARVEIFIMEQEIRYQDMDDIDYRSLHCFLKEGDKVIAYLRAFYTDDEKTTVRIGRVLTLEHGKGIGKKLMEAGLIAIKNRMKYHKITMDAQVHAIGFYEQFGFQVVSDKFLEEGVVHVVMELV